MGPKLQRYGGDYEVLQTLVDWAAAGEAGALVTVLRTWGSSPRPPGSLLAIRRSDGQMVGSVSGGCVEDDLVERYTQGELAAGPTIVDYGVDPAGAAHFGLPCGGRLELLVEEPETEALRPVLEAIDLGRLIERRVCLGTHEVSLHRCTAEADFQVADETVCKRFGPQWHLVLVGAGQIGDYLAPIALTLGFGVTICDPRTEFSSTLEDVKLVRQMPDELIAGLARQRRTAVVTLAHDPKLDDLALLEALRRDFFYLGALGSKRTSNARRQRLQGLGIDEQDLARLHAPVGIDIGSRTPAEIAVAIAADLTAARHGIKSRP